MTDNPAQSSTPAYDSDSPECYVAQSKVEDNQANPDPTTVEVVVVEVVVVGVVVGMEKLAVLHHDDSPVLEAAAVVATPQCCQN